MPLRQSPTAARTGSFFDRSTSLQKLKFLDGGTLQFLQRLHASYRGDLPVCMGSSRSSHTASPIDILVPHLQSIVCWQYELRTCVRPREGSNRGVDMKRIIALSTLTLAFVVGCRNPCSPCIPRCGQCGPGSFSPPTTYVPPSTTPAPIYVPQTTSGSGSR